MYGAEPLQPVSISEHVCTGVDQFIVGRWLLYEYEGRNGLVGLVRAAPRPRGELLGRTLAMMREDIFLSLLGNLDSVDGPGDVPIVFEQALDGSFLRYGVDFAALERNRAATEAHQDELMAEQRLLSAAPMPPARDALDMDLLEAQRGGSRSRFTYLDHGPGWLAAQVASPRPLSDACHPIMSADGALAGAFRLLEYEGRNGDPLLVVVQGDIGRGLLSRPPHLMREEIADQIFATYSAARTLVAEPHGDLGCTEYSVDLLAVVAQEAEIRWYAVNAFPHITIADNPWVSQFREAHHLPVITATPVSERGVRAAIIEASGGPCRGLGI